MRDGQQSSFATRMNQAQIDRCLPFYKDANFYAMEVWGGAVPDSVMRCLNVHPWTRLEAIHKAIGNVSKLPALSRGRNLFGYAPYTDEIIDGFCRNSIQSGLGIMRIFDALNDVNNVKSTVKYVKQYGGIADCAVCYTVDPKYPEIGFFGKLMGKKNPKPVFTDEYFLSKAKQMEALGADMITIKDMSGLIPPHRVSKVVKLFKQNLNVPIDFHTHCTPGYGLASVLAAIVAGVDIVDTNCWYFSGGTGAPAIELIYVFCKKLGIDTGVNLYAVAKIITQLKEIRIELEISVFGKEKPMPKPFNPLTDELPKEIDAEFRFKICGVREEIPYDTSKYQMQPNPELPEAGGVKLAANEKEVLLLELFPMVAKTFLTDQKKKAYEATAAKDTPKTAARSEHKVEAKAITGHKVTAPLPGKIIALKVKVGDKVKAGQEVVILEAMKMENSITSDVAGTIKQILVQEGDNVATDAILVEVEE